MKSELESWYQVKNIDDLDSPALVIFTERVQHNIQLAITMTGGADRLRPHVKTHKSKQVTILMMEAGINKFKCATIAEAEMLGQCNAGDVLLAYQPVGPKLKRFVTLVQQYPGTRFSCLCDNIDTAKEQAAAFESAGLQVPVFLDLNIGMNRTGLVPGAKAVELYRALNMLQGTVPAGLHAYDGHLRDRDFELRKQKCDAAFQTVEQLKTSLLREGLRVPKIIAGGSPTFSIHCRRQEVECSPGTFIYWDKGYLDLCPEQPFLPAAILIMRVISLPVRGVICLDLGHKSVAAENEIGRRIHFLTGSELKPISQSEEHLVVETKESDAYHVGDIIYGLPFHICPTVALYGKVFTAKDGLVNGEWQNLARDRQLTI